MIPLHRDTFSSNSVIFVLFFGDCWGGDADEYNGRESMHEPCRHFMSFHLQTWREEKKKITEFLMCLIAQQRQKVSWQCLHQPAPAGSSPHHMSAQTLTTPSNKPHGSLDTP